MSVKSTAHLLPDPITAFPLSIGLVLQIQSGLTDLCVILIDNPEITEKRKTRIEVEANEDWGDVR